MSLRVGHVFPFGDFVNVTYALKLNLLIWGLYLLLYQITPQIHNIFPRAFRL